MKYLVIGLGGFLGANGRYLLDGWAQQRWGPSFPFGTLLINVLGSLLIGLFMTLSLRFAWNEEWRLLIAIGFLGAFTTFSTFAYETLRLMSEGRQYGRAAANVAGNVLIGFAAVYLGIVLARLLLALRAPH